MLVVFPLGLLGASVVFDIVYLFTRNAEFTTVAYWTLAAGLLGGLLAAPFGFLDWLKLPAGTRAKRIGAMHGGGNLILVVLFAASWLLRAEPPAAVPGLALALSFAGVGLALVTAWLGGELVVRHAVGIHDDAGLNAESSLHNATARRRPTVRPGHS